MARAAPVGDSSNIADSVFRLSRAVTDLGDHAAMGTCSTAVQWLTETGRLHSGNETERTSVLELLWGSLSAEHPNPRSDAISALESIYDFGDLAALLGDDRVRELRRRIQDARSEALDSGAAGDLAAAERLVP